MGKRPKGELELFKFIGQQIKKARIGDKVGHTIMTQTKLANAIGVTFQQVQKYEKGVNRVPIDKLLAIGIKTKKEDINYFLPNDISGETLVSVEEIPINTRNLKIP